MERQVVKILLEMFPAAGQVVSNGDDAAVVRTSRKTAITVDTHIEGVHFQWAWSKPQAFGARLVGVVLSDLAAMGATPQYGVVSLQVPPGFSIPTLRRFAEGIGKRAKEERFTIVGGDVTNGSAFGAVLTALGSAPRRPLLRRARLGDILCVSGPIGGAAADLRRLQEGERFQPLRWLTPPSRLALGQRLARLSSVHGAMDISDGLFLDARRMAEAAGLGLELDGEAIPVDKRVARLDSASSVSEWLARLGGGEDYELLVSIRRGSVPEGLTPIGRFVDHGFQISWDGKRLAWPRAGHLHR